MTDSNATLLPCPFCGGEAKMHFYRYLGPWYSVRAAHADNCPMRAPANANLRAYRTESEAIEAWNTRTPEQAVAATLGACEPPYGELLRCLENDWHINASWDGLRKFWCIELTDEGVQLRDKAATLWRGECEMEPSFIKPSRLDFMQEYLCSECGEYAYLQIVTDDDRLNFCPNCGKAVKR